LAEALSYPRETRRSRAQDWADKVQIPPDPPQIKSGKWIKITLTSDHRMMAHKMRPPPWGRLMPIVIRASNLWTQCSFSVVEIDADRIFTRGYRQERTGVNGDLFLRSGC